MNKKLLSLLGVGIVASGFLAKWNYDTQAVETKVLYQDGNADFVNHKDYGERVSIVDASGQKVFVDKDRDGMVDSILIADKQGNEISRYENSKYFSQIPGDLRESASREFREVKDLATKVQR